MFGNRSIVDSLEIYPIILEYPNLAARHVEALSPITGVMQRSRIKRKKAVNWYAGHDALVGTVADVNCKRRQRKDTRRHWYGRGFAFFDG